MFFADKCFDKNNFDCCTNLSTSKYDINDSNNCCIQQSTCPFHEFSAENCCLEQTKCEAHGNLNRSYIVHKNSSIEKYKFDEAEELFKLMLWNLFTNEESESWVLRKFDDGSMMLDKGRSTTTFNGPRQNSSHTASGNDADESIIQSDEHNESTSVINFGELNISFESSFENLAVDQENLDFLLNNKLKVSVQNTSSASQKDLKTGQNNELTNGNEGRGIFKSKIDLAEKTTTKESLAEQHHNSKESDQISLTLLDPTDSIFSNQKICHENSTQGKVAPIYTKKTNVTAGIIAQKSGTQENIKQGNVTKGNVAERKAVKKTARKSNNLEIKQKIVRFNIPQTSSYTTEIPAEKKCLERHNSFSSNSDILKSKKSILKSKIEEGNAKEDKIYCVTAIDGTENDYRQSKFSQHVENSQSVKTNIMKSDNSLKNFNPNDYKSNILYSDILSESIGNEYEEIKPQDRSTKQPASNICNVNIHSNFQKECNLPHNEPSTSNEMSSHIKNEFLINDAHAISSTVHTNHQEQSQEWKIVSNRKRYKYNKNSSQLIKTEHFNLESGIQVLDVNSNKNGQEKLIEDIFNKCTILNNFEQKKSLAGSIRKKANAVAMKHLQGDIIKREKQKAILMEVSEKNLSLKNSMGNYPIKEKIQTEKPQMIAAKTKPKQRRKKHKINDKEDPNNLRKFVKNASNIQKLQNISSQKNVKENTLNAKNSSQKQGKKAEKKFDGCKHQINFLECQVSNSEGIVSYQKTYYQIKTLIDKYLLYRYKAVEMKAESLICLPKTELNADCRKRIKMIQTALTNLYHENCNLGNQLNLVTDEYELIVMAVVRYKRTCAGLSNQRDTVNLELMKYRQVDSQIKEVFEKSSNIRNEIFNVHNEKLYEKQKYIIVMRYKIQMDAIDSAIQTLLESMDDQLLHSMASYYFYMNSGLDIYSQNCERIPSTNMTTDINNKLKKYLKCDKFELEEIKTLLIHLLKECPDNKLVSQFIFLSNCY